MTKWPRFQGPTLFGVIEGMPKHRDRPTHAIPWHPHGISFRGIRVHGTTCGAPRSVISEQLHAAVSLSLGRKMTVPF